MYVEDNNRSCNEDQGFFGAIKGAMGAAAAPFILNNIVDSSASRIGIILLYISGGFLLGNYLSTKLNKKLSLEKIVLIGIFICFIGIFLFFILALLKIYNAMTLS